MFYPNPLEFLTFSSPREDVSPPKLLEVWEAYRLEGIEYLEKVEITAKQVSELFTNDHPSTRLILFDAEFMVLVDKKTKAPVLRTIKRHFIKRCIANKAKKNQIREYLLSLLEARLQGNLNEPLQKQLFKLDLVLYKSKFPPEHLSAWVATVFQLTFHHDIFTCKDAHW